MVGGFLNQFCKQLSDSRFYDTHCGSGLSYDVLKLILKIPFLGEAAIHQLVVPHGDPEIK